MCSKEICVNLQKVDQDRIQTQILDIKRHPLYSCISVNTFGQIDVSHLRMFLTHRYFELFNAQKDSSSSKTDKTQAEIVD